MKKGIAFFYIVFCFSFLFADERFAFLDYYLKSKSEQELEMTKFSIPSNQISEFIHIKNIGSEVYILKYSKGMMNIQKINKSKIEKKMRAIETLLSNPIISEYELPPTDDSSIIISVTFRGAINYSIEMFNLIMLRDDDYRKNIVQLIEQIKS